MFETAANSTTVEAEKEALSMAAIAAWDVENGVDWGAMQLPDGFSGLDGTYKSKNSGKTYKVDKTTAKVTEGETQEIDDDLAYVKAELEGKYLMDVLDIEETIKQEEWYIFKNTKITMINYVYGINDDERCWDNYV